MKAKALSLMLALIMVMALFPETALAAAEISGTCGENVFWNYNTETKTLILSGEGALNDYVFPWNEYISEIETILVKDGITSIGNNAFKDCRNLKQLELPSSLLLIGKSAFLGCGDSLDRVVIPANVSYIGCNAFSYYTDYMPSHVTYIYFMGDAPTVSKTGSGYKGYTNSFSGFSTLYYRKGTHGWSGSSWNGYHTELWDGATFIDPLIMTAAAAPTNDKLMVNGAEANPTVYKIGGSNYFKIRDVAALLDGTEKQFAVGYDEEKNAVTAAAGQGYDKLDTDLAGAPSGGSQSAELSNDAIYVNGEKITAEVYKIGGSNYFKLRDLGRALNFYVGWTAERGMYIETDKPYSE